MSVKLRAYFAQVRATNALRPYDQPLPTSVFRGDRSGITTFADVRQLNEIGCLYFALTDEHAASYTASKRKNANGSEQYAVYKCCFSKRPRLATFDTEDAARDFAALPGDATVEQRYRSSVAAMSRRFDGFIYQNSYGAELAIFRSVSVHIQCETTLPDILRETK